MTSVYNFIDGSPYVLNQLFGYQDAEESRQRPLRLRDALALQHRWVNTGAATPDIGTHYGNIGDVAVPANTVYYGDGSHLTNLYKGGWANLSKNGHMIATNWFSQNSGSAAVAYMYLHFYHDYGTFSPDSILWNIWPPTIGSTSESRLCTHNVLFLSGTFKLHMVSAVWASFVNAGQTPATAGSYLEVRPLLVRGWGALATHQSSSPFTRMYYPLNGGLTMQVMSFNSSWQFTSIPADFYFITWQVYSYNVARPYGPEEFGFTGMDWSMCTRTAQGFVGSSHLWTDLNTWYPAGGRPQGGHYNWNNLPMWTED
jgi:hypothetical protein